MTSSMSLCTNKKCNIYICICICICIYGGPRSVPKKMASFIGPCVRDSEHCPVLLARVIINDQSNVV